MNRITQHIRWQHISWQHIRWLFEDSREFVTGNSLFYHPADAFTYMVPRIDSKMLLAAMRPRDKWLATDVQLYRLQAGTITRFVHRIGGHYMEIGMTSSQPSDVTISDGRDRVQSYM